MAISPTQRFLLRSLVDKKLLRPGISILEIGEANWYDYIDPGELRGMVGAYVNDAERRAKLLARIDKLASMPDEPASFEAVKILYETLFARA